jgi:hypothetical protein
MVALPSGRSGSTLVLNILIMAVFAMTAVIVYASARSQVHAVVHDAREVQAQAIAEAGLEDAMHGVYMNPAWRGGFSQKPFAGGYYTVSLSSGIPPYIVSTGYSAPLLLIGRAVKTVSAQVEYTAGACPYAVMAAGNGGGAAVVIDGKADAYDITTTLTPSATEFMTGATVRSNKSVSVGGAACPPPHILGDVTHVSGGPAASCVSGTINATTTTLTVADFPEPATNDNLTGITPSSAYSGGMAQKLDVNAGQTVTLASGTYVFKQISIAGTGVLNVLTSSGTVSVYLKNNFSAASGCQINNISKIPARFHFYGINGGNHILLDCATPLHAYLEGSQSNFELSQEMYGHFCSDKVAISSTTGHVGLLHYDLGGGGLVEHVRWTTGPSGSWSESYARQ